MCPEIMQTQPAARNTKTVCLVCDRSATPARYAIWVIDHATFQPTYVPSSQCQTEKLGLLKLQWTVRKLSAAA